MMLQRTIRTCALMPDRSTEHPTVLQAGGTSRLAAISSACLALVRGCPSLGDVGMLERRFPKVAEQVTEPEVEVTAKREAKPTVCA